MGFPGWWQSETMSIQGSEPRLTRILAWDYRRRSCRDSLASVLIREARMDDWTPQTAFGAASKVLRVHYERSGAVAGDIYPLREVLFLVVCATIANCNEYNDIVDWAEANLDFCAAFRSTITVSSASTG
jgi:hypothetical protein